MPPLKPQRFRYSPRRVLKYFTVASDPSSDDSLVNLSFVSVNVAVTVCSQILFVTRPPPVSLPFSILPVPPPAPQLSKTVAAITWGAADRNTLFKAAWRQRFTETPVSKFERSSLMPSCFLHSVDALETAGVSLSKPYLDQKKPIRSAICMSMTVSSRTKCFVKDWSRSSKHSSSNTRIVRRC